MPPEGMLSKLRNSVTMFYSVHYVPDGFAQMILVDDVAFERSNYDFEYKRKEFLGEVRTLVFDVQPKPDSKVARFRGSIWIEDQDFSIVRFNGNFGRSKGTKMYFHFDSWRENLVEDLWLPAYIYTEESDLGYFLGTRKLRFKGQTRLWGYTTGRPDMQGEMTTLKVDQVVDTVDSTHNMSPVSNSRMWQRQAEDNTLNRMEKAGLIAPIGEVEKVLETVITNIEVTNNLQIEPGVRARVMLTSPLESYTVGQTIVLSRGLIDVLPDEASLAMVLAHELAHISLGHRIDTKYSFGDRMLFKDEETFHRLVLKRNPKEEVAADKRAAELLNNSPYRDKLGNAGLFLRAVGYGAPHLTSLLRPHMGNYIVEDSKVRRMAELMNGAPQLEPANIEQIAALPLGGRIRLNPWTSRIELIKSPPVPVVYAHEKMPFEVSPIYLNLTRLKATTN
jgi:hypothetical protein